jgi:WD40 repeat protein
VSDSSSIPCGNAESDERSARLLEVLARYVTALDRGEDIDAETLIAAHPDLGSEIRAFIDNEAFIRRFRESATAGLVPRPARELPAAFGPYRLDEVLGRGGMGIVYKAFDPRLGRFVALKLILEGHAATPTAYERFRREPRVVARLDHPNIVPVLDVGEVEGLQYFTMKLMEGGKLSARVEAIIEDARAAARLTASVARAVHHAHERGILHRDLKPDNVLLDEKGEPHVADFGLAKVLSEDSSLTASAELVGAASYLPPELARDPTASHTTLADVHGLGLILYELLAGRKAFAARSRLETTRLVAETDPAPPSRFRRGRVPRDLETICLRCLEKHPAKRYRSAEALATDLERWLEGRPIKARPASGLERIAKWARRHRALAAMILVGSVGAILLSLYAVDEALEKALHNKELASALAEARIRTAQAEGERLRALRLLHANRAQLARDAADEHAFGKSRDVLVSLMPKPGQPDLRGFEYYELARTFFENQGGLIGFWATALSVAFSPGGKYIAAGGQDASITLRDTSNLEGDILRDHHGALGPVRCVAFSRDETLLAYPMTDTCILLLNLREQARPPSRLETGRRVLSLAFLEDRRALAAGGDDGAVRIFDTATGESLPMLPVCDGAVNAMVPLAGGRLALASEDGKVRLLDPRGGQIAVLATQTDPIRAFAVSSAGVLAFGGAGGYLKTLDPVPGAEPRTLIHGAGAIHAVAWSPDGRFLAAGGGDRLVRVWRMEAGGHTLIRSARGHSHAVHALSFSPDSRRLASGGGGGVRFWDVSVLEDPQACSNPFRLAGPTDVVWDAVFTPGRLYTVDESCSLWRWRLEDAAGGLRFATGERIGHWPEADALTGLAISPDARWVGMRTRPEAVDLWRVGETADGNATVEEAPRIVLEGARVSARDWSADSRLLGIGCEGGMCAVHALDPEEQTWKERHRLEPPGGERSGEWVKLPDTLTFADDGRMVAITGRSSRWFTLWSLDSGRAVPVRTGDDIVSAVFSRDGRYLYTGERRGGISIWEVPPIMDAGSAPAHRGLSLPGDGIPVWTLTLTPDGKYLVSGNEEGIVTIRDLIHDSWGVTGAERAVIRAVLGRVGAIAFLPDSRAMVTAGGVLGLSGDVGAWRTVAPETVETYWGIYRNGWVENATRLERGE